MKVERPWQYGWTNFTFVRDGIRYEVEPHVSKLVDVVSGQVVEFRYTDEWKPSMSGELYKPDPTMWALALAE